MSLLQVLGHIDSSLYLSMELVGVYNTGESGQPDPFYGSGSCPLFFCLGEEVNRMSSSPSGLFFAVNVLGEEVDLMSSSPS